MKESAYYLTSALEPSSWPRSLSSHGKPLFEIAFAGRSNVGKSTLINILTNQKYLAKISSTPGKTQRLQFFCIDDLAILVDLPGYGFAKAPPEVRAEWSNAIDHYLNTRTSLKLVLLLLDIRRTPSKDDLAFVEWSQRKNIPLLPVLTKTDMLSASEYEQCLQKMKTVLDFKEVLSSQLSSKHLWSVISRYL